MAFQIDFVDMNLVAFIAEGKSLTYAAEQANLSLPAVSMRMRNLEEGLGVKLLHRTRQGVTLTDPGFKLLAHARLMLDQLEHLRIDLREYAQGVRGSVKIQATTTSVTEFLPAVLRSYLPSHPDINVDLIESMGDETVNAVRNGSADIGIISNSILSEGLELLPYRTLRLVLVTAPNHALLGEKQVSFDKTLACDYVGLPYGSSYHHFLVESAARHNRRLKMRVRVDNLEAACRMVELDIGVALLPESAALRNAGTMNIAVTPLADPWATRQLMICVRKRAALPAYARELLDLLVRDGMDSNPGVESAPGGPEGAAA